VRRIDDNLGVRDVVKGRDDAVFNTDLLVNDLDDRSQSSGTDHDLRKCANATPAANRQPPGGERTRSSVLRARFPQYRVVVVADWLEKH
jgi:hypothetical protein